MCKQETQVLHHWSNDDGMCLRGIGTDTQLHAHQLQDRRPLHDCLTLHPFLQDRPHVHRHCNYRARRCENKIYGYVCYAHVHRHQNRYLHVRVLETSRAEVSITIPANSKRLTAHSVCKNILLQKCTPHKEQPQLNAMSIPWHRATVSKKSRCIPATFFDLTMRVGLGVGCV